MAAHSSPVLSPLAVRDCAIGPATPELPLEPARLGEAVLEKLWLADEPGGVPVFREVLRSKDSGLTCMFVREMKPAIYGSVWDAVEVRLEDGGDYTILRDERGAKKRLAVKRMPWTVINRLKGMLQENPLHEIAALARLQDPGHSHVVKMIEALDDGTTVYLLTPFVDGGELFDWARSNGASAEEVVKPLFRQIVQGVRYTHSMGIGHADMSLENTLVDAQRENAFVIDFGMSVGMPVDADGRRLLLVPDGRSAKKSYCAPEIMKRKAYDAVKIDVFGSGCMLFMLLAGFPPFATASRTDRGFWKAVWKGDPQGLLRGYGMPPLPDEAANLLAAMMAYEADDRPTPEEVLKHPWLRPLASSPPPPPPSTAAPAAPHSDRADFAPADKPPQPPREGQQHQRASPY